MAQPAPWGWQRVLSVKWQREEYRLGDDSGLSNLLMPGVSYSLLRSDNRLDPNQGYRVQFDLRGAVDGVLSDANVLHGNVMLKGLTTVFDNHRLLGAGAVWRYRNQWFFCRAAVAALLRRWRSERARLRLPEPVAGEQSRRQDRRPLPVHRQRRVPVQPHQQVGAWRPSSTRAIPSIRWTFPP